MRKSKLEQILSKVPKENVILMVHGYRSSPKAFKKITQTIKSHIGLLANSRVSLFRYFTPKLGVSLHPLKRIATLEEIGRQLATEIRLLSQMKPEPPNVVLVGHSQGGLIIMQALRLLQEEQGGFKFESLKGVITIATPFNGSSLFLNFRKLIFGATGGNQEKYLREDCKEVKGLRNDMINLFQNRRIIHKHFGGTKDGVVELRSQLAGISSLDSLLADHSTILSDERNAQVVTRAISECIGWNYDIRLLDPSDEGQLDDYVKILNPHFAQSYDVITGEDAKRCLRIYNRRFGDVTNWVFFAESGNERIGLLDVFFAEQRHLIPTLIATLPHSLDRRSPFRELARVAKALAVAEGQMCAFEVIDPKECDELPSKLHAHRVISEFTKLGCRLIDNVTFLNDDPDNPDDYSLVMVWKPGDTFHEGLRGEEVRGLLSWMYKVNRKNLQEIDPSCSDAQREALKVAEQKTLATIPSRCRFAPREGA